MAGKPESVVLKWSGGKVAADDASYAINRQKNRILERTARGVDVDGRPFAPYSTNGPYYYYPNARVGNSSFTERQNKAAASRLKRKLERGAAKNAAGEMRLTRTGKGIVFQSYAAFKRWLGRTAVDLRGPRAPHMLQALVVKISGNPVTEARLGIYGAEAERASGHNYGSRRLPRRKFLGANESDKKSILADIKARIMERLR
jgi:hypothetical protein